MKIDKLITTENQTHAHLIIKAPSILVCTEAVDLRKSKNGLTELILKEYKLDLYKNIFVFFNDKRDKVKVLAWHNNGFIVLTKWLEKGQKFFGITKNGKKKTVVATQEQLSWLIAGLDWVTMSAFGELEYKNYS